MNLPSAFVTDSQNIHVIVETPKGSRNKYVYDNQTQLFRLDKVIGEGLVFPLDFGFIPQTKAEDGDPLDALVISEESAYPGCLVECRVIGIMMAEQSENGSMIRNDRVLAVAEASEAFLDLKSYKDVNTKMRRELATFFVNYHELEGKKFKPIRYGGPEKAIKIIQRTMKNANY